MEKAKLTIIPVDRPFEVCGHIFSGLMELTETVDTLARIEAPLFWPRQVSHVEPKRRVPGIHVALLYEPYPCFDSSDYATEDREYANYFISDKEFSDETIAKIAALPHKVNYRIVGEHTPAEYLPAVYHDGDDRHMTLAT